jgi:hypothetical protein
MGYIIDFKNGSLCFYFWKGGGRPKKVGKLRSRQCGILNISQSYRLPRPVTEVTLFFLLFSSICLLVLIISRSLISPLKYLTENANHESSHEVTLFILLYSPICIQILSWACSQSYKIKQQLSRFIYFSVLLVWRVWNEIQPASVLVGYSGRATAPAGCKTNTDSATGTVLSAAVKFATLTMQKQLLSITS